MPILPRDPVGLFLELDLNSLMIRLSAIAFIISFMCLSVTLIAQNIYNRDSMLQVVSGGATNAIKADAAISLADSYEELSIDSAAYFLQLATTMMDTSREGLLSAKYFYTISKIERIDGKAAEALYYGQKAKEKYGDSNDPSLDGYISIAIAEAYHRLTDYERALEYGLEGAQRGESIGDSALIAESLNIRGNIMRETNRLDEALKLFEDHYNILMLLGREETAARSLTNIGIVHAVQSKFKQSYPYFKQAINISKQYGNDYLLAFAAGSLGHTYSRESKIDSAIIYLNLALEGFGATSNLFGELLTSSQLGELYIRNENYDSALGILVPTYERSKDLSTAKLTIGLAKNIGVVYDHMNNYKLAYQYQQEATDLREAMIDEEVLKAVSDAEAKYQNEKKQLEIEQLSLKDELNNVRINRQRLALGGLGVGIGSLSFLLFRLFGQNKKIKIQNEIISNANYEKGILLKEIHHRVKNNLQVISSLLGIQGRGIKDQKAKDAIQEGRNRVQSMSLIHQNLYKKDNLTGIEMAPYIDKLSNHLLQTYQVDEGVVKIQTEVDDITLDVETVVPIGLIINELMSNALKYAFPNGQNGTLSIKLTESQGQLSLSVEDDGVGLSEEQLMAKSGSFGHSLIRAFKVKLDAEISIKGTTGTKVELIIKNYKKVS